MDVLVLVFLFALGLVSQVAGMLFATGMLGFAGATWIAFALNMILYYQNVHSVFLAVLFIALAVYDIVLLALDLIRYREEKW